MALPRPAHRRLSLRRLGRACLASALAVMALQPWAAERVAAYRAQARLESLEAHDDQLGGGEVWLDPTVSARVQRLNPLLATWETIGGCGAGGTGGQGVGVKWIGHDTTGGLFKSQVMGSFTSFPDGYNLTGTAFISRDLDKEQKWTEGVIVPILYKYYTNYLQTGTNISNAGLGDIMLLLTRRLGPINATAITATLGMPTGEHHGQYLHDYLTQDKQLGFGNFNGSLMVDQTIDESWGLIVLGGFAGYRGGRNDLGSYRAPVGSLYGYAGYFLGPLVPALGLQVIGFGGHDQDRGIDQTLPRYLCAGNASIEWSNDDIAILLGASFPFGLEVVPAVPAAGTSGSSFFQLQPWVVSLGVSVSPF